MGQSCPGTTGEAAETEAECDERSGLRWFQDGAISRLVCQEANSRFTKVCGDHFRSVPEAFVIVRGPRGTMPLKNAHTSKLELKEKKAMMDRRTPRWHTRTS